MDDVTRHTGCPFCRTDLRFFKRHGFGKHSGFGICSWAGISATTASSVSGTTTGTPTTYNGETHALYVQDSIEFIPDWKLLLGLRRDELNARYSSLTSPRLSFGETSLRWEQHSEFTTYSWELPGTEATPFLPPTGALPHGMRGLPQPGPHL